MDVLRNRSIKDRRIAKIESFHTMQPILFMAATALFNASRLVGLVQKRERDRPAMPRLEASPAVLSGSVIA
ncbi:hypothetical protein WBP07_22960 (plasmid) [Novosphingobium sp. BL-8A]|uniref:hypothetical protein n=1 Tax=Novosphingobium sp. BL-8A TaxID=3127639 RepID=UPI00375823BF